MNWLWQSGLSALAFGTAYSFVYYSVSLHKVSSIAFNSVVKCVGLVIMLATLIWQCNYGSDASRLTRELRRGASDWRLIAGMSIISLMWFTAEILFYKGQSLAPNPANATAIWNLSPVPVFLMSVLFYKSNLDLRQWIGLGVLTLSIYLINIHFVVLYQSIFAFLCRKLLAFFYYPF